MSPARNSDGLAGAHASIGRLKRLIVEFDAVNPSIGQADGKGAFEKLLLEILAAVGWRGERRRLFEALPHVEPIASFNMLRAVLARLDVSLVKVTRSSGELSTRDFPC